MRAATCPHVCFFICYNDVSRLNTALHRRLKTLKFRYGRFTHHFSNAIRHGADIIGTLSVVAAVACLVCLIVLVGYDHSSADRLLLGRLLRACQITFIVKVAFGIVLRFRNTVRETRLFKWFVDGAVLLTLLPLVYPHPEHPWIPMLERLLYSNRFLYTILGAYAVVEICYAIMRLTSRRTNPSLLLSGSFLFFILIGSFVLMLPKCTVTPISYVDSLFVATSAVCITGLTPVDVSATFTPMGIGVLAVLFQIGGIGVLTFTSFFAVFFSGSTSVYNQLLIRDMVYSKTMNALLPTLLYIIAFTLTIELIGAAAIYFTIPDTLAMSETDKLIFAGFHSLSSFCNAGFSCLPQGMANPALMTPGQSLYVVTSILIFAGAIGFPILVNFKDIIVNRVKSLWRHLKGQRPVTPLHLYDLNTKLVLVTTTVILAIGSVAFFVLEYNNTLAGMTLWQKAVQSVFNSLIPRSAGFASVNPADFLSVTLLIVMAQMWIGGASQSLAGGIKVNTVAALFLNARSVLTGGKRAWAYDRAISVGSVRRANTVLVLAIAEFMLFTVIIMLFEPQMGMKELIFEVISAVFTIGSSLGATADLCTGSKITLCFAMFLGRVSVISLLSGFIPARRDISAHLPEENIIIN